MNCQVRKLVPGKLYGCYLNKQLDCQRRRISSFWLYEDNRGWCGHRYTGEFLVLQLRPDINWTGRKYEMCVELLTATETPVLGCMMAPETSEFIIV